MGLGGLVLGSPIVYLKGMRILMFQLSGFYYNPRVLGTIMGDICPNHNTNYYDRNPTFYYIGTLDPLGKKCPN